MKKYKQKLSPRLAWNAGFDQAYRGRTAHRRYLADQPDAFWSGVRFGCLAKKCNG